MKTKNKKYLPLYECWGKSGKIGMTHSGYRNGLCDLFKGDDLFSLFYPTEDDFNKLREEGKCSTWWAGDVLDEAPWEMSNFTPLRQTIILFMCALNEEL